MKIKMHAHIIVTKDGTEWSVYGWSGTGHPAAAPVDDLTEMVKEFWTPETGDRHLDIEFEIDVPEAPPVVTLQVSNAPTP